MSNISFSELLFILILAFVILGPEKLQKAMYSLGLILKKIRQQYQSFQAEVNSSINNMNNNSENKKD